MVEAAAAPSATSLSAAPQDSCRAPITNSSALLTGAGQFQAKVRSLFLSCMKRLPYYMPHRCRAFSHAAVAYGWRLGAWWSRRRCCTACPPWSATLVGTAARGGAGGYTHVFAPRGVLFVPWIRQLPWCCAWRNARSLHARCLRDRRVSPPCPVCPPCRRAAGGGHGRVSGGAGGGCAHPSGCGRRS